MPSNSRIVIVEKYKHWDYVDQNGNKIWTNRYGDIVRKEDKWGRLISFKTSWKIEREMLENLQMYGMDFEPLLTTALVEEMAREIDNQVLNELRAQIKND